MVYTDVLQGAVFLGAALAVAATILGLPGVDLDTLRTFASADDHTRILVLHPWIALADARPLATGLVGGAFLTLATHGTDHDMVQRLLTTRDGAAGGRALFYSALLNFPLTALFLALGTGLAAAWTPPAGAASSQLLPLFALEAMPPGLRGLLFAGILAAAMSSFDSAVCAIATSWMVDVRPRRQGDAHRRARMRRVSTAACAAVMGAAFLMALYQRLFEAKVAGGIGLIELALSTMTILYGGLLGIFARAVLVSAPGRDSVAPFGLAVGAVLGALLFAHPVWCGHVVIAWPWWIPITATSSFLLAYPRARGHDARCVADVG